MSDKPRVRSEYIRERERHWEVALNCPNFHVSSDEVKRRALADAEACDAVGYEWAPEPPQFSPNLGDTANPSEAIMQTGRKRCID